MNPDPITPHEVKEDLLYSNEIAEDYVYEADDANFLTVKHYDIEGTLVGTQSLSFNIGEFKPVTA